MSAVVVDNKNRTTVWWKRAFRSLTAVTGLLAGGLGVATSAPAQENSYRSAASAPATWQAFARQLRTRFEHRLAADDPEARKFQDLMAKREAESNAPPILLAKTWISPDGAIERIEFDGLDDDNIAASLRAILTNGDVGAPPPDMLQPLRLRLLLRPREQPGRGE